MHYYVAMVTLLNILCLPFYWCRYIFIQHQHITIHFITRVDSLPMMLNPPDTWSWPVWDFHLSYSWDHCLLNLSCFRTLNIPRYLYCASSLRSVVALAAPLLTVCHLCDCLLQLFHLTLQGLNRFFNIILRRWCSPDRQGKQHNTHTYNSPY